MMLPPNKVLIAPDANHTTGAGHGVDLVDSKNDQFNLCITGTVIQVCDELEYFGYEIRRLKRINKQGLVNALTIASMPWDTSIEVSAGDRVIFSYHHRLKDEMFDDEWVGDNMLLGYENIIGVVRYGAVYPLNGNLFAQRPEKSDLFPGLQDGIEKYLFRVISCGIEIQDYLDYGTQDLFGVKGIATGSLVLADDRFAISLETPQQMRIFDAPTYYFQRRHVFAKLKNNNV